MPDIRSKGKYGRLLRIPLPMGASSMITGSFHFNQPNPGNSSYRNLRHTTVMTQTIACTPLTPVFVPVKVAILPKKTPPSPGIRISSTLAMVSVHEHCKYNVRLTNPLQSIRGTSVRETHRGDIHRVIRQIHCRIL